MIVEIVFFVFKPFDYSIFLQIRRVRYQYPFVTAPGVLSEIADNPMLLRVGMDIMDQIGQLLGRGDFESFIRFLKEASCSVLLNIDGLRI